jgi:hypothetical protein
LLQRLRIASLLRDESLDFRLLAGRQIAKVARDGVRDDVPLCRAPHLAEGFNLDFDVRRDPHAELRIICDPFSGSCASARSSHSSCLDALRPHQFAAARAMTVSVIASINRSYNWPVAKKSTAADHAVRRGRPSVHGEAWSKVSVVLMDRQIRSLDSALAAIRRARGTQITRAALIRALIDGVLDGGFDLASITSEVDLQGRLSRRLHKTRSTRN